MWWGDVPEWQVYRQARPLAPALQRQLYGRGVVARKSGKRDGQQRATICSQQSSESISMKCEAEGGMCDSISI